MPDGGAPLPSGAPGGGDGPEESELTAGAAESPLALEPTADLGASESGPAEPAEAAAAPPRPTAPRPTFKFSTFIIVFLGLLGLLMLFDTSTRNGIACYLGTYAVAPASPVCPSGGGPLYSLIGFSSNHLFATMAIAGAIEMVVTAFAYNYTTDWVKTAKVQKWSSAFRKVQMEAIRSGKKDRIAALRPHQERITRMSSEVSIAQFKGMAITYFMLILMYTWVGLVIQSASAVQQTIQLNGGHIDLMKFVISISPTAGIPWWFAIFSLYTVPFSLVFRRILKHFWVRRYAREHRVTPATPIPAGTGGAS